MKKKYIVSAALILSGLAASAQNVGINVSGATPHASSILDLNTGNTFTSPNGKGMLIPNVALTSTGDATTVASPATSLMVYNTATAGSGATAVTPGYYYWDGTKWVQFQSSSNASQDWKITGNSGTTAGTNFVGTTDAVDFVTKTNNAERMRVTSSGNVGIGTTTPSTKLEVDGPSTGAIKIADGNQATGKVLVSDANGVGTWQNIGSTQVVHNVTTTRTWNTAYTNTSPNSMFVFVDIATITLPQVPYGCWAQINGINMVYADNTFSGAGANHLRWSFMVPPGATYIINITSPSISGLFVQAWNELY